MSGVGRLALGAGRLVLVGGLAAGVVHVAQTTSWSADLSRATASADRGTARTTVRDAELVCAGHELAGVKGVKDTATGGSVGAASPPASLVRSLLGTSVGSGTLTVGSLSASGVAGRSVTGDHLSAPLPGSGATVVAGTKGLAPSLVATQEWSASTSTLRGLVTSACGAATADAWLVGGGGAAGRQERLVLVNPGANVVTADVILYGTKGQVDTPNGTGLVVPAHGRTAILLDALSSTEPSPVVHVTTRGGLVRATLNDSWLDGSVPAGVDDATAVAAPATRVVVPAVALAGQGALRVAVAGSHEAVVQVRTLSAAGGAPLPQGGVRTVAGHATAEFDLSGVPAGTYAVEVTADEPVVAAAVSTRHASGRPGDFAWSGSSEPIGALAGTAFPPTPVPARSLGLVSSGAGATVSVTVVDGKGAVTTRSVEVAQDATADVRLPSGVRSVWVHRTAGSGQVRGAVLSTLSTRSGPMVSAVDLSPAALTATSTAVVPLP